MESRRSSFAELVVYPYCSLSSIFAEYCVAQVKALHGRYREMLIATLVADYATSMLEFDRIVHYSDLLLAYLYPPLILLTVVNLALALRESLSSRHAASGPAQQFLADRAAACRIESAAEGNAQSSCFFKGLNHVGATSREWHVA